MEVVVLLARLLLSVMFLVAGAAKLLDRPGSRQSMVAFGLPERMAGIFGLLLPAAELLVGLCLAPVALVRLGAAGGLLLLLVFCGAIAYNLAVGRKPECHCFGQLHSAPAGWSTLCRNAILAVIAGIVFLRASEPGGIAGIGEVLTRISPNSSVLLAAQIVELAVLAGLAFFLLQVIQQNGRLLLRLDALEARTDAPQPETAQAGPGLPVGTHAPPFTLAATDGPTLSLHSLLLPQKPLILVFVNPGCGPCQVLLPKVAQFQRNYAAALRVVVISEGSLADNQAKAAIAGVNRILLQEKREVAVAYEAHGTPAAVVVEPDGRIGSPVAFGADAMQALFTRMAARPVPAALQAAPASPATPRLTLGDKVPVLQLGDIQGKAFTAEEFRGQSTLMIFWNPDCGFCQKMLPDLRSLEETKPNWAPAIILLSSGSIDANRAMKLQSRIVLDPGLRTGAIFGANGTPMGLLVDSEGRIASEVVAGGVALMELAKSATTSLQPAKQ